MAPDYYEFESVPPKNLFMVALLYLKFPLWFPPVKAYVKTRLKYCQNIDFIHGFRFLYGNIHAKNVFLSDAFFADYAPIYIGEDTFLSFDNMFLTSTHDLKRNRKIIARPIIIGRSVWITSRCIILGGVHIGDNSVIGAGSVVTSDIPANCLAAGNPANVIRYFTDDEVRAMRTSRRPDTWHT